MVRLVLVSHSQALATALVAFIRQMAGDDVPIDVAAGTGDRGDEFGTDATTIATTIRAGSIEQGVVLIADVGSAVMSAEMALDLLGDPVREHVVLADAPLVEGALSAAVQAGLGADLETVVREAETAGGPKRPDAAPPSQPAGSGGPANRRSRTVSLPNEHGLHARPAAQLVRAAGELDASVTLDNLTTGRGPAPASSISAVARLGATQGHDLRLSASGPEAEAALQQLGDLIADGFGEDATPAAATAPGPAAEKPPREAGPAAEAAQTSSPPSPGDDAPSATPVVAGTAVGPAVWYAPSLPDLPETPAADPDAEWTRLSEAIDHVRRDLQRERASATAAGSTDAAGILDALLLLLDDASLLQDVRRAIQDGRPGPRAWTETIEAVASDYEAVDDAYLAARGADVRDVGRRVVYALVDDGAPRLDVPEDPFVLVAERLAPSDVSALPDHTQGVLCVHGNPTSHSAILLRARSLPAVFNAGRRAAALSEGTIVGLDGRTGEIWTDLAAADVARLRSRRRAEEERAREHQAAAQTDAHTSDGTRIRVEANVNRPVDAGRAADNGADGVGLLRTEFLFLNQSEPPDETAQADALARVADALPDRPVTVRALDVGGDKPLPYLPLPPEDNPFLGIRGVRLLLREPSLLHSQLRSILRVAASHPVRLLLPMVVSAEEVRRVRDAVQTARDDLADDRAAQADLPVGVMIETPASAVDPSLADVADFFSVGTNDLTQYTMAADRGHEALSHLTDALAPAVLRLLQTTIRTAEAHDVPVGCCGEAAADVEAVPVLLGLGLRSLSVAPPAIPEVKAVVRRIDLDDARDLADRALTAASAAAVRARSRELLSSLNVSPRPDAADAPGAPPS